MEGGPKQPELTPIYLKHQHCCIRSRQARHRPHGPLGQRPHLRQGRRFRQNPSVGQRLGVQRCPRVLRSPHLRRRPRARPHCDETAANIARSILAADQSKSTAFSCTAKNSSQPTPVRSEKQRPRRNRPAPASKQHQSKGVQMAVPSC